MATFGDLVVNLGLNQKPFANGVNRARSTLSRFGGAIRATGAAVGRFGLGLATVGGGALSLMVRRQMQTIDSLAKTSDKLGIATHKLAGLQHAAELTGVSSEKFNMALQRMTRRVSEAANGSGEAVSALKELGISAQDLSKLTPDQQFARIADAMQGVESQSDRVRLAFKLFDSEGVGLVNTLKLGSAGLNEVQREAERLGIALSRADAAKIEQANDAITKMKRAFDGVVNTLAVNLAPWIEKIANHFTSAGEQLGVLWRNGADIAQLALVQVSIAALDSFSDIEDAINKIGPKLAGIWAGGQAAMQAFADNAVVIFRNLGGLLDVQLSALSKAGGLLKTGDFKGAAQAFTAKVFSGSINTLAASGEGKNLRDVTGAFTKTAKSVEEATKKRFDESGGIRGILADRRDELTKRIDDRERAFQNRFDNIPGDVSQGLSAAIKRESQGPEGLAKGSKEFADRLAQFQNRSGGNSPEERTARQTEEMAEALTDIRDHITSQEQQRFTVGAFV